MPSSLSTTRTITLGITTNRFSLTLEHCPMFMSAIKQTFSNIICLKKRMFLVLYCCIKHLLSPWITLQNLGGDQVRPWDLLRLCFIHYSQLPVLREYRFLQGKDICFGMWDQDLYTQRPCVFWVFFDDCPGNEQGCETF